MNKFDMDVRRLAFIQMIVDHLGDVGKTKVQKISCFLQEALSIPLKYRFRMHYSSARTRMIWTTRSLSPERWATSR